MGLLIVGLVLFIGAHVFVTLRGLRRSCDRSHRRVAAY
jgi:hypothetical protein